MRREHEARLLDLRRDSASPKGEALIGAREAARWAICSWRLSASPKGEAFIAARSPLPNMSWTTAPPPRRRARPSLRPERGPQGRSRDLVSASPKGRGLHCGRNTTVRCHCRCPSPPRRRARPSLRPGIRGRDRGDPATSASPKGEAFIAARTHRGWRVAAGRRLRVARRTRRGQRRRRARSCPGKGHLYSGHRDVPHLRGKEHR